MGQQLLGLWNRDVRWRRVAAEPDVSLTESERAELSWVRTIAIKQDKKYADQSEDILRGKSSGVLWRNATRVTYFELIG